MLHIISEGRGEGVGGVVAKPRFDEKTQENYVCVAGKHGREREDRRSQGEPTRTYYEKEKKKGTGK